MTLTSQEAIERFQALHAFDLKILRLERELDRVPAALEEHQQAIAKLVAAMKVENTKLTVLRHQIKLRETDLKTKEEKQAKLKEQSSEVRTNKEFVAFRSEIANTQDEIDRLQGEILKILEVVEAKDSKQAELTAEQERIEARIDEKRTEMEGRLADVKAERDGLEKDRVGMTDGLPEEPLRMYERTRSKRGQGAATLEGAYCGACGDMLVRNEVYAVQNRTRIVFCRSCTSLLLLP